jgi:REP element-mobilizing transposase RayT
MPRRPRQEEAGAIHHVYARGIAKRALFRDQADGELYLATLEWVVKTRGWRCLSYCLMPNHVHLLVETREPNLGLGMHRLHGDYAAVFNRKYGLSGHVFESRFHNVRMRTDAHLVVTAAYIALNPIEARLCERPEDWPWSSHGPVIRRTAPDWVDGERLLGFFGAFGGQPLERYARAIEDRR